MKWILMVFLVCACQQSVAAARDDAAGLAQVDNETATQFKQATELYREKRYSEAAALYLVLSETADGEQAAWALELYALSQEKQGYREVAITAYQEWLAQYSGSEGQTRVKQRLMVLQTSDVRSRGAGRSTAKSSGDTRLYGSASLMYRGLSSEVEDQGRETTVSSLSSDVDLHLRSRSDGWAWRGRVSGGYLSDQSDRSDSNGRVSNLYLGAMHEASGLELTLGRQRSNDTGIYGYLDGVTFSYPVLDNLSLNLAGGTVATFSTESPDSDRLLYALGAEFQVPDTAAKLELYIVEQTYDSITERRAIGGNLSYFNEHAHYFLVTDYDVKFNEINNVMFSGRWTVAPDTNLAIQLGNQRSPFLTASNAIIGEYGIDLADYVGELRAGMDVYDAALDRTALSRYASVSVNQRLAEKHNLIGEVYYYELSDLPDYGLDLDLPDSDTNTTLGLQYIWADALLINDYLSMGVRYTAGDVADSATLYLDEKLRLKHDLTLVLRLHATRRWLDELDQDAYTLRPGIRLEWYCMPNLLLETELGYEWLGQDFMSDELESEQAFALMGLRKRF